MLPALHRWRWQWPGGRVVRIAGPAAALILLLSGLPDAQTQPKTSTSDPFVGTSPNAKFNRQLAVFERVLDDVLIDSEHALVDNGRNVHGAYLSGQGAVFAFEFSLVGVSWGQTLALGNGTFISPRFDGDIRYYDSDDDDDDRTSDDDKDRDKDKDKDREKRERERERRRHQVRIKHFGRDQDWIELDEGELKEHQTRQYVRVKEELIDALGDYGDLLEGLPADEWVTLIAGPRDLPWGERKIKRLVIRAHTRDIVDRAEDRIDDSAFRSKVVIEEYK